MKLVQATTLLALLLLASCGGGSGAPTTEGASQAVETVASGQVSYVEQLRGLEKTLIARLLEAQDLYVSDEVKLTHHEKLELIKIFKQDQADLKMVEEEISRALELEKIQKMSYDDVLARFSDRLDDVIVVQNKEVDLIELHQAVLNQDPVVDQLIAHKVISTLENNDLGAREMVVYQSGVFIYLQ